MIYGRLHEVVADRAEDGACTWNQWDEFVGIDSVNCRFIARVVVNFSLDLSIGMEL